MTDGYFNIIRQSREQNKNKKQKSKKVIFSRAFPESFSTTNFSLPIEF
jgi:hypothetical protein